MLSDFFVWMRLKKIYQTVRDDNNPDEVEQIGPFRCVNNPWLGEGYYFWDTFIELAHWWGRQGYENSYMICQASCENDSDKIFDLVGDTEHLSEIRQYKEALEIKNPDRKITVPFIIQHMRRHSDFDFCAIRASAIDTVKKDVRLMKNRIIFRIGNTAYLDTTPAIQLCIINKKSIAFKGYKVIFPEEYCPNYTI